MIKLSIIIPHYNTPKLLGTLLDSIPKRDEIEVIVVDDNTDNSKEKYDKLINLYKNKNITFVTKDYEKPKGAGASRNIALDMSKGEWILFADSDDCFTEGFYGSVKKYFKTNNDVIFFKPTSIDLITGKTSDRHILYEKIITEYLKNPCCENELYVRYRFNVPWSKLYNRKFLVTNEIRFDEIIASNDVMFSTKAGYHMDKYQVSNDTIYCATTRKGSLTKNMSESMFDMRVDVTINRFNFLKERLRSSELKKIDINGRGLMIRAFKYKYSFKNIYSTYRHFRKNKVPVIQLRIFNPVLIVHHLIYYIKEHRKDKNYLVK